MSHQTSDSMLRRQAQRQFQRTIHGKNKVEDPYASSFTPEIANWFKFAFPLQPQSKAVGLPPDVGRVVQPEVAVRYLENIGVTPSASNLKLVMPHVSVDSGCKLSLAFKTRGCLTDVLHVTPHWAVKEGKSTTVLSTTEASNPEKKDGKNDANAAFFTSRGKSINRSSSTSNETQLLLQQQQETQREVYRCKNVKDWVLEDILRVFVFPFNMQHTENEYAANETRTVYKDRTSSEPGASVASSRRGGNSRRSQRMMNEQEDSEKSISATVVKLACEELLHPLQTTRSSIVHVIKDTLTQLHVPTTFDLWHAATSDESVRVVGLIAHFLYWELLAPSMGHLRDSIRHTHSTTSARKANGSILPKQRTTSIPNVVHVGTTAVPRADIDTALPRAADATVSQDAANTDTVNAPQLTRHERESVFVVINQLLQKLLHYNVHEDTSFHLLCIRVSVLRVIGSNYASSMRALSRLNGIEAFFELDSAVLALVDPEQIHSHVPTLVSSLEAVRLLAESPRRRRQHDSAGNSFQPSRIYRDQPLQHAFYVTSPLIDRLYGGSTGNASSAETRQMHTQRAKHDLRRQRQNQKSLRTVKRKGQRGRPLPGGARKTTYSRKTTNVREVEVEPSPLWHVLQAKRRTLFDGLTGDALLLKNRNALQRMAVENVSNHFGQDLCE